MNDLIDWRENGKWPIVHNAMTCAALVCLQSDSVLDLGCGHGLLGAAVSVSLGGTTAVGIDADEGLLKEAEEACVGQRFYRLDVSRETLPGLQTVIDFEGVTSLLAWRILPDLWGHDLTGGFEFAKAIAAAGVREVLIESGSVVAGSIIRSLDDEIRLFSDLYREVARYGDIAYLRLK